MRAVIDLKGKRFGRLLVLSIGSRGGSGQLKWLCLCECGKQTHVFGQNLRRGISQSCGCLNVEKFAKRVTKHGFSGTSEMWIWIKMRDRCLNPKSKVFQHYGGRGIKVCDRWLHSFENFLADMGKKPEGKSLDRIDNNGPYSPENCRWADRFQQSRNRRNSVWCEFDGKKRLVAELCAELGVENKMVLMRLALGWPIEKALTTKKKQQLRAQSPAA